MSPLAPIRRNKEETVNELMIWGANSPAQQPWGATFSGQAGGDFQVRFERGEAGREREARLDRTVSAAQAGHNMAAASPSRGRNPPLFHLPPRETLRLLHGPPRAAPLWRLPKGGLYGFGSLLESILLREDTCG